MTVDCEDLFTDPRSERERRRFDSDRVHLLFPPIIGPQYVQAITAVAVELHAARLYFCVQSYINTISWGIAAYKSQDCG